MGRTFIRQDAQIRNSVSYDDTVAPTLANYETNPTEIQGDLNNVRSMLSYLKDIQSGNWYDVQVAPSTLEAGTLRGIDDVNDALHLVEKKRVLRDVTNVGTDVTVPADAKATGNLDASGGNFVNNDTVTIGVGAGSKVYTFKTALTPTEGEVLLGGTATISIQNLVYAITHTGTPGTDYDCAAAHTQVTASTAAGPSADVEALTGGTWGNLIVTTTTAAGGPAWGAALLTGGAGDMVVLSLAEIPSQDTAAIGAVTTLGTVVAYNSDFLVATLDEVAGGNNLEPKSLMAIVEADSGDPILSSGRQIWGLFQSESNTNESTMTGTTPNRAQITFVRPNSTFDDLELCPSADIAGQDVQYTTRERVRLEDLNEDDFLRGAIVDVGGGSGSVTRQVAYDNQGATAVDVTTNSTLDLEGASLSWTIRDDLEAALFTVTEGSAGGTSKVVINADTDTFDVDAVVNDFLNGASFDTGAAGTTINVGVTANQIDSGGALTIATGGAGDLKLDSVGAEILFDDVNRTGSTWAATSVKLSETTAEWDAYEVAFGEVSLMNAIVQAKSFASRVKAYAAVSSNIAANVNATGAGGAPNLDAQLPDYSGVDTFVDDVDVYLNGEMMRNGADAAANHDVYPGTTPANGDLMFEFGLVASPGNPDVICMIAWGS